MVELAGHIAESGGTITRTELDAFRLGLGETRRLVDGSRGIWNPGDLAGTLSIVSDPPGPYDDRDDEGGLLRYSYRKGSSEGDNAKLRRAMQLQLPLILLRKIKPSLYMPVFPVFVVGDDVAGHEFIVALSEELRLLTDPLDPTPAQRRYAQRVAWQRLHQPEFRVRVLRAYETKCSVCGLRRPELLDAAHIVGGFEDRGDPVIPNGLSMCKIHHAAFDRNLLGVTPDRTIQIKAELLEEVDGPMLEHGLKEMHQRTITVPLRRVEHPDRERLDVRYGEFLKAS
jgi:putative restriction endonuclease